MNDVLLSMGARCVFDYAGADDKPVLRERLTHCYELAAWAFTDWPDKAEQIEYLGLPTPVTLVHGMWQGPEPVAIGHAWVVLSDGAIWEPISMTLCDPETFYEYTRGVNVETYSETAVAINMVLSGHFGPWHE